MIRVIASSLSLVVALTAHAERVKVPAPSLPAPGDLPAYEQSSVRVPIRVPFSVITDVLERDVPHELGTGTAYESYVDDEGRSADVRYVVQRGAFTAVVDGDELVVGADFSYTIDVRGDFGQARCGEESKPMEGRTECRVRVGWGDGWRLDARASRMAFFYRARCKPKPPGINFSKMVGDVVATRMMHEVPGAIEREIKGSDTTWAAVTGAWDILQEPIHLAGYEMWLSFRPVGIVADQAFLETGAVSTAVAVEVWPHMSVGNRPDISPWALPDTQVRLAGEDLYVAFDCGIPLDSLAAAISRSRADTGGSLRVVGARVTGAGDRVVVALTVEGSVEGTLYLTGTPAFDLETRILGVSGLDYTSETKQALAARSKKESLGPSLETLRASVDSSLSSDISAAIGAYGAQLGRGLNGDLARGISIRGGTDQRSVVGTFVDGAILGVRLLAEGHATLLVPDTTARAAEGAGRR